MTTKFSNLQLRLGPNPADPLLQREPQCLPDGVFEIGKGDGTAWRYLPEGYGAALATSAQLQQLADELASLRSIAATDADLDAELAELQVELDAIAQSSASDQELATAIAPIAQSLSLLASEDAATSQGLANLQSALDSLVAATATDQELAEAIASVMLLLPIRSATPPTNPPIGQRWIELNSGGEEIYDQPWIWRGGEWQLERRFISSTGSGRISGSSSPRSDLGSLPALPGIAGYRLHRATVRARMAGAGSWVANLRQFVGPATIQSWLGPLTITASGDYDFAVPSGLLNPSSIAALELNLIKGATAPDSLFTLSCQWAAVRS